MYILLLLVVGSAAVVVDFLLLTNFKASILMAGGTLIVLFVNYGISKEAIHETAPKYLNRLTCKSIWYKSELRFALIALAAAFIFVAGILFFWYIPRGYSVNMAGVVGSLIALILASFAAHLSGTLRGMQDVPARS